MMEVKAKMARASLDIDTEVLTMISRVNAEHTVYCIP